MKCFYHRKVDAIGMCKSCHKGLCEECAEEVVQSIACKGKCEDQVAAFDALMSQSLITAETQKKNRNFYPVFFVILGLVFMLYGYGQSGLLVIAGGVFAASGILSIFINRKWVRRIESET